MNKFNEDVVEQAAIGWLQDCGYDYLHGGVIAPGEPAAERESYNDVLLVGRLRAALERINGHIPRAALPGVVDEAIVKIQRTPSQNIVVNNHAFHQLLTEGLDVSYRDGGQVRYEKLWLVDFADPAANDWLAVNQFTVTDINHVSRAKTNRRTDIVLFVNGLPLGVIELKTPPMKKPPSTPPTISFRPTKTTSAPCSPTMACWRPATLIMPVWAQSQPVRNGSNAGARWMVSSLTRTTPNLKR